MKNIAIISISVWALSACTWVNENDAGKSISITTADQVSACQSKGKITARVKNKVGFINRSQKKVLQELQVLARNEAVKLKANTIVAEGEPKDGQQLYMAYSCP